MNIRSLFQKCKALPILVPTLCVGMYLGALLRPVS